MVRKKNMLGKIIPQFKKTTMMQYSNALITNLPGRSGNFASWLPRNQLAACTRVKRFAGRNELLL